MVNINIGVLGHVDSGKTSLSKALSRVASTAAFDKNPQSQERGITLDLGFSAFFYPVPPVTEDADAAAAAADKDKNKKKDDPESDLNSFLRTCFGADKTAELELQFTLVDCPGHASLIRAVMGAAHIIDLMILVVDITKGIQAQTAECLVLGEMLGRKLVVVLNKVDMVPGDTPEEKRQAIDKKKKQLRAVFSKTRWPNAPFVEAAANPGASDSNPPVGVEDVKRTLALCAARMARAGTLMSLRDRSSKKLDPSQFFMMVDHCFAVKGHGTVLTGTVVGGTVAVGEEVKLPDLGLSRRVKSIQVFRKPVEAAHCGDRIGLCITQVNAERLERGIACSALPTSPVLTVSHACVMGVSKVRFHKSEIESTSMQFHVTIGHVTAMATMKFFSKVIKPTSSGAAAAAVASSSASATPVSHAAVEGVPTDDPFGITEFTTDRSCLFDFTAEYEYEDRLSDTAVLQLAPPAAGSNPEDAVPHLSGERRYYAVLLLDRPVTAVVGSMVIASHLDGIACDKGAGASCRLAMHGVLLSGEISHYLPGAHKDDVDAWRQLKVVRYRERGINIDKIIDPRTCVARPQKIPQQQAAAAPAQQQQGGKPGAPAAPAPAPKFIPPPPGSALYDLVNLVGTPVVFRKKIKPPTEAKSEDDKKKNDGDDDDAAAGGDDEDDDKDKKKKSRGPRAPLPTVDIPGRIDQATGTTGKVRITFTADAFEGNRAFGSILMRDKKYPFATEFKVENAVQLQGQGQAQ